MDPLDEGHFLGADDGWPAADEAFRPALRALLKALREEARLGEGGRRRAAARIADELARRRALSAHEARLGDTLYTLKIERPLVITGFPRTGTTLLLNLLARTRGLWSPPLWQLREPVVPVDAGGVEIDDERWATEQRRATRESIDALTRAAPGFPAIRPMDPDWPDECNWLLRNCFSTLANAFTWFVPSYVEFLGHCDMRPAYADHARWLRTLLHRRRQQSGQLPRLVLKDPFHLWQLEALLAVYPDATVIHLHREPDQVAPSLASLCATWQAVDGDAPRSSAELGAYTLRMLELGLRALERSRASLPAERFIDLPYRELIAAPGEVVRRLGAQLGFDGEGSAVAEADRWLRDNRSAPGRHRYKLDDHGFDEEILDESFAEYRRRFAHLLK